MNDADYTTITGQLSGVHDWEVPHAAIQHACRRLHTLRGVSSRCLKPVHVRQAWLEATAKRELVQ